MRASRKITNINSASIFVGKVQNVTRRQLGTLADILAAVLLLLALSFVLSACGRHGALQPPPGNEDRLKDNNKTGKAHEKKPDKHSDKFFIFDRLLE